MFSESLASYLNQITDIPVLSREEEICLPESELIKSNLKLVVTVASKYQNRGVPLEDLVSSGNIGLMKAAKSFKPERGNFSRYASKFISGEIYRHFEKWQRTVRLPASTQEDLLLLSRIENEFWNLTDEQLVEKTGFNQKKIERLKLARQSNIPLDENLIQEGENPAKICEKRDNISYLLFLLSNFPKQERIVINRFFGLKGDPQDFTQIGSEMGVTRQRVGQIYKKAIEKLKKVA